MTTLNTIISTMEQTINESVAKDLTDLGFSHSEAVKVVVENDFDLIVSAEMYPVEQF